MNKNSNPEHVNRKCTVEEYYPNSMVVGKYVKCSNCGLVFHKEYGDIIYAYCPHCGCKICFEKI